MDGHWIRWSRRNSRALVLIPFVLCAWLTWSNGPALGQPLSTARGSEERPDIGTVTADTADGVPPLGDIQDILRLADEPLEALAARPVSLQFLVQNLLNERIYHPEFARRNINSLPGDPGRTFYGGVSLEY